MLYQPYEQPDRLYLYNDRYHSAGEITCTLSRYAHLWGLVHSLGYPPLAHSAQVDPLLTTLVDGDTLLSDDAADELARRDVKARVVDLLPFL